MSTIAIIVIVVVALAVLLFVARGIAQRRRIARERKFQRLEAEAEGHRSMAMNHREKADELRDAAETEQQRAERHAERAAEVQPNRN